MAEPYESCVQAHGHDVPAYCFHNGEKIKEQDGKIEHLENHVNKIHGETLEHITRIEERMADIEKNHAVLTERNTAATNSLTKSIDKLSNVHEQTISTLSHIEGTMQGIDQRVTDSNKRIDRVQQDVKSVQGQVADVKVELKAVDDKTKIDVAKSLTEEAKKNIWPAVGTVGGIGAIIYALFQFFM